MAANTKKKKATAAKAKVATANESKGAKFKRLADARVSKVLKQIALIGNLSGSGYEYEAAQVEKIQSALVEQVKATMGRFTKTAKKDAERFSV
jgi:ACT domain-containing protein